MRQKTYFFIMCTALALYTFAAIASQHVTSELEVNLIIGTVIGTSIFMALVLTFWVAHIRERLYRQEQMEKLLASIGQHEVAPSTAVSYFPIRDDHFYLHLGDYLWRERWRAVDPSFVVKAAKRISGDPEWVSACLEDMTDEEVLDELLGSHDIQEQRRIELGIKPFILGFLMLITSSVMSQTVFNTYWQEIYRINSKNERIQKTTDQPFEAVITWYKTNQITITDKNATIITIQSLKEIKVDRRKGLYCTGKDANAKSVEIWLLYDPIENITTFRIRYYNLLDVVYYCEIQFD